MNAMIAGAATGAGGANRPPAGRWCWAQNGGLDGACWPTISTGGGARSDRLPEARRAGVPQAAVPRSVAARAATVAQYFPGLEED